MDHFDTYFFDFDGTIGDTEIDIRSAWLSAISELGLPNDHYDSKFRVGPPIQDTAKMLYPDLSAEDLLVLQNKYKFYYDDCDVYRAVPYPGIIEAMRALHRSGKKIYIVTYKRYKPLEKLVKQFGLEFCNGIFAPDIIDKNNHLRKPELLALALQVSVTAPENALMVGDTVLDATAAKACGVPFCAVTWGYGSRGSLESIGADFIIDHPSELV
ncbi:MAG: HAD family hydrolase [Lentisphaerae bacterium]|nr:HAD family hydrolase [Lentisphaerota bacterium]